MRVRHRNLDAMFRLILLIRGRIIKNYVKIYIGNLRSFMVVNLTRTILLELWGFYFNKIYNMSLSTLQQILSIV